MLTAESDTDDDDGKEDVEARDIGTENGLNKFSTHATSDAGTLFASNGEDDAMAEEWIAKRVEGEKTNTNTAQSAGTPQ